ncbi:MAG: hypothetical protein KatS3mg038_2443 [Candidatus Kapaibacterium sp.]|nr:MAG: hypothetical protein KatS3mg038_2443 [Candidatus Kapabacteria bacterium]
MDRRSFLGASDAPAILGLSPWRTAYEVWAEKTGRIDSWSGNAATSAGQLLEPAVLAWASEELRRRHDLVVEPGRPAPIEGTPILTHPDALALPGDLPVEAKTTGIVGPVSGEWGEDGTDEVPDYYLVQLAVQAAALRADRGFVSALIGGSGFRLYEVAIPSSVRDTLVERLCGWWQYHVIGDRPPADEPPPLDVVSRLRRTPGLIVPVSQQLIDEYESAKAALAEAQERADRAKAALLAALGDAEEGVAEGGIRVTYYSQTRKEYVVPASSYRVLRIKKPKEK